VTRPIWISLFFLLVFFCPSRAFTQERVPADQAIRVTQLFNEGSKQNDLKCQVRFLGPLLGFDLNYTAGFVILPSIEQVTLNENLDVFVRITPAGRAPVLLSTSFQIPASLPQVPENERFKFFFPGEFAIGEGTYHVDLLVIDQHDRRYLTQWTLKVNRHVAASQLGPLTVSTTPLTRWDGDMDTNGPRLTILLDATETSPNAVRLGRETSTYLVDVLGAILRAVRCRSVKVVAFNLDEQREIFHDDLFEPTGFATLAQALRDFTSVKVPAESLKSLAWLDFLVGLARGEMKAPEPPDAVIFVGPPSHFVGNEPLQAGISSARKPLFFDFEYLRVAQVFANGPDTYRGDYRIVPDDDGEAYAPQAIKPLPDAVDHLTRDLHGIVFQITSPKDLGPDIQRMATEIRSNP